MEIIKAGKNPQKKVFEGSCVHCHCKIRCTRDETKSSPDPRDNGMPFVDCPTEGCGGTIWVKSN